MKNPKSQETKVKQNDQSVDLHAFFNSKNEKGFQLMPMSILIPIL